MIDFYEQLKLVLILVFGVLIIPGMAYSGAGGFWSVQSTEVLEEDAKAMSLGGRYEIGRGDDAVYDNLRIHPVMFRQGLGTEVIEGKPVEAGASISYSSNQADDQIAPDESGLEGVSLFGQVDLSQNLEEGARLSPTAGITLGGSNEILPYINDSFDLWFNVPAKLRLNESSDLYGEIGFTIKNGESNGGADLQSYPNFGVGVRSDVQSDLKGSIEISGHGATIDQGNSYLELIGKLEYDVGPEEMLVPSIGIGMDDGSPDVGIGAVYTSRI